MTNAETDRSAEKKSYLKDRREWLHKHHFCVDCKTQDAYTLNGKCRCYECTEKARIRKTGQVYKRNERIEFGLCVRCGKPAKEGYKVCEEHYKFMVGMSKEAHKNHGEGRHTDFASNPQMPRSEWVKNGFCYLCGDKALKPYKVCEKCRERLMKNRQKQKELGQDRTVRQGVELLWEYAKYQHRRKQQRSDNNGE